jgi:DNA invertase Pin-like site-specific DNA recombinase
VLGYVRVSTEEQCRSGAGLCAQRDAISEACKARGYKLLDTIEDAGYSAKSLERPGIIAALAELDAGRADALMVAKLDRLSRSMLDFAQLMERAKQHNWSIIALDLGVDTSTPAGEMLAGVLALFAQYERRLIGQRITEALAVKKAQGVRIGRPRSLPDKVVQRIVRERAKGLTLRAIADGLNRDQVPTAHGGAAWYGGTVRIVLASVDREHERAARLAGR